VRVRTFAVTAALVVGGSVGAMASVAGAAAKPKPCTNIATAVGKNGKPLKNSGKENGQKLFKGRPSAGPHDQERVIGATANVSGYTTTVLGAQVFPQIDDFQNDGYFKVTVRICSRDDGPQRWSVSDWKLQTPSGNTVSPTIVVSVPTLDYAGGELATDGRVEGDVYFQVGNPAPPGTYYVLYEPDFLNETHGVWQVNI
jgi:hypothetical protein